MGRLLDGQTRTMRPSPWCHPLPYKVVAERVDSETPIIHIKTSDATLTLSDSEAGELITQLTRAIRILPSSK